MKKNYSKILYSSSLILATLLFSVQRAEAARGGGGVASAVASVASAVSSVASAVSSAASSAVASVASTVSGGSIGGGGGGAISSGGGGAISSGGGSIGGGSGAISSGGGGAISSGGGSIGGGGGSVGNDTTIPSANPSVSVRDSLPVEKPQEGDTISWETRYGYTVEATVDGHSAWYQATLFVSGIVYANAIAQGNDEKAQAAVKVATVALTIESGGAQTQIVVIVNADGSISYGCINNQPFRIIPPDPNDPDGEPTIIPPADPNVPDPPYPIPPIPVNPIPPNPDPIPPAPNNPIPPIPGCEPDFICIPANCDGGKCGEQKDLCQPVCGECKPNSCTGSTNCSCNSGNWIESSD